MEPRSGVFIHGQHNEMCKTPRCAVREVVIDGQPGNVLNCEEAVLRVAEGNVDGLDFVEIRHEAGCS